ncbi:hypothetical protein Tco_1439746 [Tanacetum coccineum]
MNHPALIPSKRMDVRKRLRPKDARGMSKSPEPRRDRSRSPRRKDPERETVFRRLENGVFHRLGDKEKGMSAYSGSSRRQSYHNSRGDTESYYQSSRSRGTEPAPKRHHDRKAYSRKGGRMSESEDSAGGHWKSKSTKQSHVKTYDESEDSEDHLKIFQAAAKQKKCIKDLVEIRHIKQREWESTEDFVRRFKIESRDVKGAPEVMRISGFMHGIMNPELIKRLYDKIPKSIDEIWKITTSFLRGEVAAGNQERKKTFPPWKQQDAGHRQNFKKGCFKNQQRSEKRQDRFALLTKTPKEILALDKGKFKPPPLMTTPVEKRNSSKFCRKAVAFDQRVKAKQRERPNKGGKEERSRGKGQATSNPDGTVGKEDIQTKDHPNILSGDNDLVPTLRGRRWNGRPMVIKAEVGGHLVHRMYTNGGAFSEILYEHCFNQLHPEIRNQMVLATTYLVGFSGEIIWPLGQVSLLVKIGDEKHSTSAWMNFMIVRSHSSYNGIIGRPGVRRIKAIPSTTHGMLKFPVVGGMVTLRSSKIIPLECAMISGPRTQQPVVDQKPADMTEVPRHIAEHRLNVHEGCFPVRQKKRGQAPDRNKAISEDVEKLVNAGIMKEVYYHSWLSNPVMVKKHDNSRRMCVDFKYLNKACPKDGYPLSEIDWKVESLCGYPFKCFLDAYKGYLQIKMAKEDEEKTASGG